MKLSIPYGDGELPFELPEANLLAVVRPGCELGEEQAPSPAPTDAEEQAEIRRALAEPIGAPRLSELSATATSAVIVVSDITRPCPSHKFLPALLAELAALPPESITVLFALGGHRKHTREEQTQLVGREVASSGVCLLDLDAAECVPVGTTSRGTRLEVFKPYLAADLRICTGNIEYHYFAGFSGGAKAVVPGLCSYAAIRDNHSMMLSPTARAGILEGNPVRDDIDEAGGLIGVDYIFNVVLDEQKRVIHAVAGHYLEAHREGVRIYDGRCDLRVEQAADVVIASPGGKPKDINLYQAQKTLDNVGGAVRDGGVIILVARCPEGFGQGTFEDWMLGMGTPQVLVDRIQREFVLGGHKAAAIAGLLTEVDVYLVSEFPDEVVRSMCMQPFASVDEAVAAALERLGPGALCLVVPHGNRVTARGEVMEMHPTQDACRRALVEQRRREGFRCPRCAHAVAWYLRGRGPCDCAGCGYQASLTAGALLHKTRTDLRKWLLAIWLLRRKITQAMRRGEHELLLRGAVEQTPEGGLSRAHLRLIDDAGAKTLTKAAPRAHAPQAAGELLPWVHIVTLQLQALATRRLPWRQRRAPAVLSRRVLLSALAAVTNGSTSSAASWTAASCTRRRPHTPGWGISWRPVWGHAWRSTTPFQHIVSGGAKWIAPLGQLMLQALPVGQRRQQ